jgi:exopolysaccharide biosynthesis polyprenyl glycosylphosphotransferase
MDRKKLIFNYVLGDFLSSLLVWSLFSVFRKVVNDRLILSDIILYFPNYNFFSSFILFVCLCLFIHTLSGYYVAPYKLPRTNAIITTFISSFIITLGIFFTLMIDDKVISYHYYFYSMWTLLGLQFFVTSFFRGTQSSRIRINYKTKRWTNNTLVIGTEANAKNIAFDIEQNTFYNSVIGFIQVKDRPVVVDPNLVLGNLESIGGIINSHNVKEVIIALENADDNQLYGIITPLFKYGVEIEFTPRLYEILTGSAKLDLMGLIPLVSITKPMMSNWEMCVKRFVDILVSSFALLFLSPVFVFFMIRIRLDSKGSVFYKQERIGYKGKPFMIYKFRTMFANSENGTPKLSGPNDDRITPVGRILRRYRLDEFPQFFNILKGDMSLVGPRPERQFFIDKIVVEAPYYCLIYNIRPGLTSWGPIKVGYTDTTEKMIARLNYDIIYLENMSLFTDLKILIYTVEILLKGKGM